MQRTGLDGVDIDFEGPDVSTADRDAYIAFAKDLCDSLHPKNKIVTVASFPAQWNAPNWDWWTPLYNTAKVDGICTMGYDWSGKNKDYAAQAQHASAAPSKFMIGMPGWVDTWQGNTASEQLDWIIANGVVGMGIWDAALTGAGQWQGAEVWNKIKLIREKGTTPVTSSAVQQLQVIDNITITTAVSSNISISVHLEKPGRFTARIYDLGGRMIKELFNNECMQNAVQFGWNGHDGNGAKVSAGSYVVSVSTNENVFSKAFVLAR